MPTVPGLVPDQKASVGATPELSVNAPVEAFGGSVGVALQGLGKAVDQAGDEIWKTALKIQETRNQTEADEADTRYMEKAGMLHAEFNALQGENATKAFPDYIKNLKAARDEIKGTLSNDAVRRLYDRGTNSTLGRTIFNGAGHAASQAKKAQIDAVGSKKSMVASQAITADNDDDYRALKNQARELTVRENALLGQSSGEEDLFKTDSVITAARIQHIAKTDPFKAHQMLAENKKGLTAQDFKTTDDIVTSNRRAVGAANIAREEWNAQPDASLGELQAGARKKAEAQFPKDEIAASHAENAVTTLWNRKRQAEVQDSRDAKNDINSLFLTERVTNLQELLAIPEGRAAYDKLDETQKKGLSKEIESYVAAKSKIADDSKFSRLHAMARSDDPNAQAEFLNTPLATQGLSPARFEQLNNIRKQLTKDPKTDARTTQAMKWLRDARGKQLEALRIYKRTGNEEAYDDFVGALVDSMQDWTETNKKAPGQKDVVDTIAPMLLQKQIRPGKYWGSAWTTETDAYIVPDDYAKGLRAKAAGEGKTIDDRMIRRAYVNKLFNDYRSKASSDTK